MFASWSCIVMTHNSCKLHISTEKGSTTRKSENVLSFSLLPYFSCLLWLSMIPANAFFWFFFEKGSTKFFYHCYSTPRASLQSPGSFKVLATDKAKSHQNVWLDVALQINTIQARNFSTILFPTKRTFVTHLHTFSGCLNCLSSLINYVKWSVTGISSQYTLSPPFVPDPRKVVEPFVWFKVYVSLRLLFVVWKQIILILTTRKGSGSIGSFVLGKILRLDHFQISKTLCSIHTNIIKLLHLLWKKFLCYIIL